MRWRQRQKRRLPGNEMVDCLCGWIFSYTYKCKRCKKNVTCDEFISQLWKKQNPYSKKTQTEILPLSTTTVTWKAGRVVCRAPRLLRFGGCRCPAEGLGRHPVADLGRGRPVAVAHHGCSVWRSSNVFRQHQVFEIPVKRLDDGHLEFDEKERILDHKKNVEDFKFGIWWKPCRSKEDADIERKWMSHYRGTREICWSCPGWKRVLGHVVCHSQLAPQQLQRSLDEGRIFIHQEKIVSLCMKRTHTHTHSMVIWLIGSKFDEVDWLLIWRDGLLSGVLWSEWYQFSSLGQLEV